MTEVLSITVPEGNTHFGSSLRRSSSQTSVLLQNPSSYSRSPSLKSKFAAIGYDTKIPTSLPSSAPSSPRLAAPEFSNQPSYTSTPSSSLSLDETSGPEEETIVFPLYDDGGCFDDTAKPDPPLHIETVIAPIITQSVSDSLLATRSRSDSSEQTPTAGDDSAIRLEPTRHVDYLSHNWNEEDIWSSWRHIVAKRKVYSNSSRLENASWRTWAKSKYRLRTVSPEALNW